MEVGRIGYSLEDDKRYEVLGGSSSNRYIEVKIYYPVSDETIEGKEKSSYVSKRKLEHLHPMYKKGIKQYITSVNVYDDVEPAEGVFPIVFFQHGYGGFAEQNTRMVIDLVKSGFVVVSVGHSYEASVIDLNNGGYVCYDKKIKTVNPMIPALFAQNRLLKKKMDTLVALEEWDKFQNKYCKFMMSRVKVWADDVLYVLEDLKKREKKELFKLSGKLDFSNIGTTGHSFGGCTSYYLCMYHPEFKCGINIDGGIFGTYEGLLDNPFMQISCTGNINVATRVIAYRQADVYRLTFNNMKHIGFSDAKYIIPKPMYVGKLGIEKMENALFAAHREFFSKYLKNQDNNFEYLNKALCEDIVFESFLNE